MSFIKNCGIMVEPQEGIEFKDLMTLAKMTEDRGFGYFLRSDHLTTHQTDLFPECWSSLGAIAALTKTIKFGPLVSPIGFRNPALLARMACTVDSISSGRLQLGLGAGHVEDEYLAHGFEFPSLRVRKKQFSEALQIIRPLTQTGRVDFDGDHFSAHLDGIPGFSRKIRMVIGGKSRFIVQRVLEFADEWNCSLPLPMEFELLRNLVTASHRRIEVSQMAGFVTAEDSAAFRASIRRLMRKRGVAKEEEVFIREMRERGWFMGTPDEIAPEINRARERGIEKIYFQMWQTADKEPIRIISEVLRGL
ncbi:MAG: LLM class flavin-dependent oxidoreductase [Thaumarchaeota archaeon]|nr:LLM class flavin-dependent oxidoreductase [Nitrososphaerota archaeon]